MTNRAFFIIGISVIVGCGSVPTRTVPSEEFYATLDPSFHMRTPRYSLESGFELGELPLELTVDGVTLFSNADSLAVLGAVVDGQTHETFPGIQIVGGEIDLFDSTHPSLGYTAKNRVHVWADSTGHFSIRLRLTKLTFLSPNYIGYFGGTYRVGKLSQ